jgi:hypothetical protein
MRRKRAVVGAVAVLATTAGVAGAGARNASGAEEAADWRTTRFVSQTLAEKQLGSTGFVGTDEVRKRGEVIGYNSLTGRYFPARNRIVVRVGIALKGGVIMGRVAAEDVQEDEAIVFRGPILGGSGRYDGIRGRIVARIPAGDTDGRAHVTLRWRT